MDALVFEDMRSTLDTAHVCADGTDSLLYAIIMSAFERYWNTAVNASDLYKLGERLSCMLAELDFQVST